MKAFILGVLSLTGCAAVPPFPAAGTKQADAPQVANPNCVIHCVNEGARQIAQDNSAPVTLGAQTQQSTDSTTNDANVGVPKRDD